MSAEKGFYDRHWATVERTTSTPDQRWVEIHKRGSRYFCITDFLKNQNTLSALEWGFGDASLCVALTRLFGRYHAVDLCATDVASKYPPNQVGDISYSDFDLNQNLPFADEEFDVSIAMMVIEHLFNPFHSMSEIARTTKRGGYVFINLPLLSSIKNRALILMGNLPMTSSPKWWDNEEWDGGHLHYFTIPYVKRLALKYGLQLVRFYPVGNALFLKKLAPSLFCHEGSFVFQRRA